MVPTSLRGRLWFQWKAGEDKWKFGHQEICILTEVIEHWPRDKVVAWLDDIVQGAHPTMLLITTPVFDANSLFGHGKRLRHPDHLWEATQAEGRELMESLALRWGAQCQWEGIGRPMGRIWCTAGMVFKWSR